jgi:DedD protein
MDKKLLQRLIGAIVILALIIIFVPMLFSPRFRENKQHIQITLKPLPKPKVIEQMPTMPTPVASKTSSDNKAPVAAPKPSYLKPPDQKRLKQAQAGDKAWVVQMGIFSSVNNAKKLVKKLRDKGFTAFGYEVSKPGGAIVTRVYVGPAVVKGQAKQELAAIKKQLGMKGLVVEFDPTKL